jgi:hypothetical protein
MKAIFDRALSGYDKASRLNPVQIAQFRERTIQYVNKLISAGQTDSGELTEYARAYLKEMHEGRDPRFTGC